MARTVIEKIHNVLSENMPGIIIEDLEKAGRSGRIGGVLIWDDFKDMDQMDRQQKVWAILRSHLTKKEQLSISLLITLTPDEFKSIRAA